MDKLDLYPESPRSVPKGLTKLGWAYRFKALATLASIFLFVVSFLGLVAGSFWLGYQIIVFPLEVRASLFAVILKFAAGVVVMAVGFLAIKFLFKAPLAAEPYMVELDLDANPKFHAFLKRIAEEARAPMPKRVYYCHHVNAAVLSKVHFYNILIPGERYLVIGMGLVNALNLSEFKATIAHELGHFAQGGQRLGAYVHLAKRAIFNIVVVRDELEQYIDSVANGGYHVFSLLVMGLQGMIWLIRKFLGLFYLLINYLDSRLSQDMEFNADLVAVKVAGSDAIVHTLYKTQKAEEAFSDTLENLAMMAHQGLFSDDPYQNHIAMMQRRLTEVPMPNGPTIFSEDKQGDLPPMYSSHPSNYLREKNAKTAAVAANIDDRPAWGLFDQAIGMRKILSDFFNEKVLGMRMDQKPVAAAAVEDYLAEERQGQNAPARYKLLYAHFMPMRTNAHKQPYNGISARPSIGDLDATWTRIAIPTIEGMQNLIAEWEEFLPFFKGEKRAKKIMFRGMEMKPESLESISTQLLAEINQQQQKIEDVTQTWYAVMRQLAQTLGETILNEYDERWRQQVAMAEMLQHLIATGDNVNHVAQVVATSKGLSALDERSLETTLSINQETFHNIMKQAKTVNLLKMVHIAEGQNLHDLLTAHLVLRFEGPRCQEKWLASFLTILQSSTIRLQYVMGKNHFAILLLWESIEQSYEA